MSRHRRSAGRPGCGRVVLINQYFWPDVAATAQLLADLAEDLAAQGWKVTALAGIGQYAGRPAGSLPRRQMWRGVTIRRVWCTDFGRGTSIGRMVDYFTFLVSAGLALAGMGRKDVVVCLSTPPLVAVLGLLARLRGERFVYKVEDLFPDLAISLGVLKRGGLASRILAGVSRLVLTKADAVVGLDEAMRSTLRDRGARRTEVIPNWADGDRIRPDAAMRARFRREWGLSSRFVLLYSGNFGMPHRFDAVAEAARLLESERPEALFLFVGDGVRLEDLRNRTARLTNVRFVDYRQRRELGELYNAADVHLVTLRDEVAGCLVPSKYVAALAAGKPVLLVGGRGTDLWREVEERRVGWSCVHDARAIVTAVGEAMDGPEAAERASRARRLFESKYDRRSSTGLWLGLLSELAAPAARPARVRRGVLGRVEASADVARTRIGDVTESPRPVEALPGRG